LRTLVSALISTSVLLPTLASAGTAVETKALRLEWNARLRHESVGDDGFARTAEADTLRLRLGLRAHLAGGWSALLEGEGIAAAGDRYNSSANGRTAYPLVADPSGGELNQAWVGWQGGRGAATFGRQRVLLDNQRWVGNSGWRQNEQTFDAAALEWRPSKALILRYLWLDRVHRVNGDQALDPLARERDLDSHLLDIAWMRGQQQWGAYAYAHEDRDVATASTMTTGLRWTGSRVHDSQGWGWRLEAARQQEQGNNPLQFSHAYWLLEPSLAWHGVTWRAGWEHLGGNGQHALQTPLATLHAFNGWADKFVVTPADGLDDRYLSGAGVLGHGARTGKCKWTVAYHDYQADHGGRSYGGEWNASLGFPLHDKLNGLVKLADYRSDGFGRDTRKLWLQLEWSN
jgi:hypothetical protein